jgi:hypothetical protein
MSVELNPRHILTNMPPGSNDVLVGSYFPDSSLNKGRNLPTGEDITVLVHFANEANVPFNITGIMGSINDAKDFSYYLHNFTFVPVDYKIEPSEEVTLAYKFQIPGYIPIGKKYIVANTVFYEERGALGSSFGYSHTFHNSTVKLYSNQPELDRETVTSLATALATTLFVLYLTCYACSSAPKKGAPSDRPA